MKSLNEVFNGEDLEAPFQSDAIRLVLADSQGVYRAGICKIIALETDIRLLAQADTIEQLCAAMEQHQTDVVLAEGELLIGARDSLAELQRISPGIKIIAQTTSVHEIEAVELYRHGVRGIISRSISPDLLIRCIRCVNLGETWIDNQALNWVISAFRAQHAEFRDPSPRPRLSPKETEIVGGITRGMRNKEIAFELGTTEQVIKNYLRKIYDKLGVADRLELAMYSLQQKTVRADVGEAAKSKTDRQIA